MTRANLRSAPRVRWYIDPPMPDETLESICERAYHQYKGIWLAREGWLVDFCRNGAGGAMPRNSITTLRLARALGVRAPRMHAAMLADAPWRLAPAARRAYCRACWVEDDRHARPRYFRRDWAGALTLHCAVHGEPLRLAAAPLKSLADIAVALDAPALAPRERRVLALVDTFAQQLYRSVFRGAPWPASWAMGPLQARNLVGRCISNLLLDPAPAPAHWVWFGESAQTLCHDPRHALPPTRASPWEAFRQAASPAARRAALWQVAWWVLPDRAAALRPDGLAEHLINEDPAAMARESPRSAGRRMRRLRTALAKEFAGWPV